MASNEVANQVNNLNPNAEPQLGQAKSVNCSDLIPRDLKDTWSERDVVNHFAAKVRGAIQAGDLRGALLAYSEAVKYVEECGMSEAGRTKITALLNDIAAAFKLSQGELLRQLSAIDSEVPDLQAIINELAQYIRSRTLHPLSLDELINSISMVIDQGSNYLVTVRLTDPTTGELKEVVFEISSKELSKVLKKREEYDMPPKKKRPVEIVDPSTLIPRILEPYLVKFAIAHRMPIGFTSYDFVNALINDVFPRKLIGRSKTDELKVRVATWLASRVYTYVSYDGGARVATVKRVDPRQAIYIDRANNLLLVPPPAYFPNVRNANEKNQMTVFLKKHGILINTRGHYTVYVNEYPNPLEYFYVFDLAKLEEFVGYRVEELAIPDRKDLLLSQTEIEEIKKDLQGDEA
ncbi:MAG: hypothetical protein L7H00_03140 [Vulcanisaeta sp.]|nr:hypothetical protein [Vulcanisaeta sp.]MCG2892508.1 hypothetical protein [Vulcanisaeta sp.]